MSADDVARGDVGEPAVWTTDGDDAARLAALASLRAKFRRNLRNFLSAATGTRLGYEEL